MAIDLTVRARIEAVLGGISATLTAVTAVWPDWFERVFEFEPDAGDGSAEWGLVAVLALATLAFFALSWRDWRRAQAGTALAGARSG